jgi:hypothetical protein
MAGGVCSVSFPGVCSSHPFGTEFTISSFCLITFLALAFITLSDIGVADAHWPILGLLMQLQEKTLGHTPTVRSQEKGA